MLSVAKLALGQEAYYEQQVALGLDDYYAGRGESPGLYTHVIVANLARLGVEFRRRSTSFLRPD